MNIAIKFIFTISVLYCDCAKITKNVSYENVIDLPISVNQNSQIRQKRNTHAVVNDNQRPKNYHPSLPLPSPFIAKDLSYVREKRRRPDKVLLAPLYFSYNKKSGLDSQVGATNDEVDYEEHPDNIEENNDQPIEKQNPPNRQTKKLIKQKPAFHVRKTTIPVALTTEANLQQRKNHDEDDNEYDEQEEYTEESKDDSSQEEINQNSNSNEPENISKSTERRKTAKKNVEDEFYFEETPQTISNKPSGPKKKIINKATTTIKPTHRVKQFHYQIKHEPSKILKDTVPNQQATNKQVKKLKKIINNPSTIPPKSENLPKTVYKQNKKKITLNNKSPKIIKTSKEEDSESISEEQSNQQLDYPEPEEQKIINTNKTPPHENVENNSETTFVPIIDLKDFVPTEPEIIDYNLQERYNIEDNIKQKLQKFDHENTYNAYPSEENDETREVSSEIKPNKYVNNEKSSEELQIPTPKIQFELNHAQNIPEENKNHKKIIEPIKKKNAKPYFQNEYIQKSNKQYKDPEKEYLEHTLPIKDKIRSKINPKEDTDDTYLPKSSQFDYDYTQKDSAEYIAPRYEQRKLEPRRKIKENNQKSKLYKQPKQKPKIIENFYDDTEEETQTTKRPKKYRIKLQKSNPEPINDRGDTETLHSVHKKQKTRPTSNLKPHKTLQTEDLEDVAHAPSDNTPKEHPPHAETDSTISEQKAHAQVDSQVSEQKHPHAHNGKHAQGGGKEHHSEHHGSKGEKAESNHKGKHEHHKKEVGHHDKEGHKGGYKDHGGHGKKSHSEEGYFGGHKENAKGEKASEFEEKGEHKKGHSTKGEHNVHKKEEYSKTKHFFDEEHEEGDYEKHGGYHEEHGHKKGGKHKYGHLKGGYKDHHYGKKGKHAKGSTHHEDKGHKKDSGHDKHYKHIDKYGKKHDHDVHKKWGFKKGKH